METNKNFLIYSKKDVQLYPKYRFNKTYLALCMRNSSFKQNERDPKGLRDYPYMKEGGFLTKKIKCKNPADSSSSFK